MTKVAAGMFLGLSLVGISLCWGDATLTVVAPVLEATCNISIPQGAELALGRFMTEDFFRQGGTAAIARFQVKVGSCTGSTVATPALKVTGTTLTDNLRVFNSQPDGSTGFMIRAEKYTGSLDQFYSNTDPNVVEANTDSYSGSSSLVSEGVLDYTVGFVAPGLASSGSVPVIAPTEVKANVTFEFLYH